MPKVRVATSGESGKRRRRVISGGSGAAALVSGLPADGGLPEGFVELLVVAEAYTDAGFLEVVPDHDLFLDERDDFGLLQAQEGGFIHFRHKEAGAE